MRALFKPIALGALFLCLCLPVRGQQVDDLLGALDLSALYRMEEEMDLPGMVEKLARGEETIDPKALVEYGKNLLAAPLHQGGRLAAGLCVPALVGAALGALGPGNLKEPCALICLLVTGVQLAGAYGDMIRRAGAALGGVENLCQALYPALGALLTVTGKGSGAALFTPAAALAGGMVSAGVENIALPLVSVAAALSVAGNLSPRLDLNGLADLLRRVCALILGGMMTLFAALMGVQGLLSRGYDGASMQAARFAVGSLLPVVGGEVADSLEALLSSAVLVKNAVGITGLMVLGAKVAGPMAHIGVMSLALRLSGALMQVGGAKEPGKMVDRFAQTVSLLLGTVAAGAVLVIILVGAALWAFSGGWA